MSMIREAISAPDGTVDVAYLALFWLIVSVLGAISFLCVMEALVFWKSGVFDAQAFGIAVGAICGGFATALAALAAYMGMTRSQQPQRRNDQPQGAKDEPCR